MASPWTQIVVPAQGNHTATVILFHGFGENGNMWLPIATELSERLPHVKFILPNANARPITALGGAVFPAWLVFLVPVAKKPIFLFVVVAMAS
jgi:predicted esterase